MFSKTCLTLSIWALSALCAEGLPNSGKHELQRRDSIPVYKADTDPYSWDAFLTTEINLDGISYTVLLDSSSQQLVLKLNDSKADNRLYKWDDISVNIPYYAGEVNGSYYSYGDVKIGDYEVSEQGFIVIESGLEEFEHLGIEGILGIGFDDLSITEYLNQTIPTKLTNPSGSTDFMKTPVNNIFRMDNYSLTYYSVYWSRDDGMDFSNDPPPPTFVLFNDLDHHFSAGNQSIPHTTSSNDSFSLAVDVFSVNGNPVSLKSSSSGAQNDQAIAYFYPGFPNAILPSYILEAIYGSMDGAIKIEDESNSTYWVVPCNGSALVEFTFEWETLAMNNLDLIWVVEDHANGTAYCVSAAYSFSANDDDDWLLGGMFFKNVHTVFDYSTSIMIPESFPQMKFSSLTASDGAKDNHQSISESFKILTPEEAVTLLTGGSDNDSDDNNSSNGASSGLDSGSSTGTFSSTGGSSAAGGSSGTDSSSSNGGNSQLSEATSAGDTIKDAEGNVVSWFNKNYAIAVLSLLAGTTLLSLISLVLGVAIYVRKGKASRNYKSVPLKDPDFYHD